jgi:hypothetical protein
MKRDAAAKKMAASLATSSNSTEKKQIKLVDPEPIETESMGCDWGKTWKSDKASMDLQKCLKENPCRWKRTKSIGDDRCYPKMENKIENVPDSGSGKNIIADANELNKKNTAANFWWRGGKKTRKSKSRKPKSRKPKSRKLKSRKSQFNFFGHY